MVACAAPPGASTDTDPTDTPVETDEPDAPSGVIAQQVVVQLDGEPVEGATVMQPGRPEHWFTAPDGTVEVALDFDVLSEIWVSASHPSARTEAVRVREPSDEPWVVALTRFDDSDNPDYTFQDPGTPFRNDSTRYCSHCHVTINEDWYGSMHAQAASNQVVHDLYAGTSAHDERESCEAAGGRWLTGPQPGSDDASAQCYLGAGVLADLNATCAAGEPCEGPVAAAGACADCHAPGMNGALGGRDLLQARDIAFEAGVHCDVCHKVESVDLDAAPGTAGRLNLVRPSEPSTSPSLGEYLPLNFGPHDDVPNVRMGNVQRDHFRQATLCAGCHEQVEPPHMPGAEVDLERWPSGHLPIQTTYSEWRDGPLGPDTPCQSCHMPPDPRVKNSADLQLFERFPGSGDIASGWARPPGAVRRHTFVGPRSPGERMLELSASVQVDAAIADDQVRAHVTVRNVGPGHALPTGEPMRHLVLRVAAACGDRSLPASGGHAIPDFGGALDRQDATDDWSRWPGARVGEWVRVVARSGTFHDPPGWGPFGEGRFSPEQKGMPVETVVGAAQIVAVEGDLVTFNTPLPAGDLAYRVDEAVDRSAWPAPGDPATAAAGGPGFAFARITVDPDGVRHGASHRAVDIASDNRLPPGQSWTSEHQFELEGCAEPRIGALLTWRAYPVALAREKAWSNPERVLVQTWRTP